MKVTFNQHIGTFENAVSSKDCQTLIDIFESNQSITRQEELKHLSKENISPLELDDRLLFLNNINPKLSQKVSELINTKAFKPYLEKYVGIDYLKTWYIREIKIQKTLPSQGFHRWHYENDHRGGREVRHRMVAWTLYLNDVKEGGETEFLHQSLRIPPTQGTICIFPSYFTHMHRGNPPLSGVKYIATGWIIVDDKAPLENE